ncbi:uncharacterized protein LOC132697664 [Cylas formicarius]|uniref:uncharacterized protein LOC132697238 n=1 Tax=Cylas formicarius TaxID=197179 RepID=UPI0029587D4D|nr:uncharacterized protein LOC132697238 [Cylas formicarius]XP_060519184.1 uncharacterized protein LOC132697664 [Cylas formicarius]
MKMRSYRARMLGYTSALIFFLTIRSLPGATGQNNVLLSNSNEIPEQSLENVEDLPDIVLDEEQLDRVGMFLTKLLLVPWPEGSSPLLYIEKDDDQVVRSELDDVGDGGTLELEDPGLRAKRTRYYRKYPWKRQNNRYEPSYVCTPKKDDVFRLLMALHGERNGQRGQFVDFCNRKRPATFVFTNIRFLG